MATPWLTTATLFVAVCVVVGVSAGGVSVEGGRPCVLRSYGYSSTVCVCNASYCDAPPPQPALPPGSIAHYTSSRCGLRRALHTQNFTAHVELPSEAARLLVNTSQHFQQMLGFGGAMTDSTAINIRALSAATQEQLIKSYFGSNDGSSRYSLVRLPMGGTDCSTRNYTYDDSDKPDPSLKNFTLQEEDIDLKIPLLLWAQNLSNHGVRVNAVPWSAPSWMKDSNGTGGITWLKSKYYQTWANYFMKFLKEYARRGVDVWAVSLQNEPTSGNVVNYGINSMGWDPKRLRRFMENNLGPTLRRDSKFAGTRIIIGEDNRDYLHWSAEILESKASQRLASGVALHWYADTFTDPGLLDELHQKHPDKFFIYTEACYGLFLGGGGSAVRLGDWKRGENYSSDIIQTTNHWTSAWEDWNMVLDLDGGPTWINNRLDAAIIVNATADEFYKQPMYYAIWHFSHFVPPGSQRISLQLDEGSTDVESVAFLTPDHNVVVVLQNGQDARRTIVLRDPDLGDASISLPPRSLHTLVYARANNTQ